MVIGTRVLRQFLENIVAFYDGREYWKKVDWELLIGECPFPAYDIEMVIDRDKLNKDVYEPG